MSFQVLFGRPVPNADYHGHLLLLADGRVLPFEASDDYVSVTSWFQTGPPEEAEQQRLDELSVENGYANRSAALEALSRTNLPPEYIPSAGAFPLIGTTILPPGHILYRYSWTATDPAFNNGRLQPNTYFTSVLDQQLANTGFGAVGRYALPIPAPAVHVFQYQLPSLTTLKVGTVAPMFGQAGGGVEAQLSATQSCKAMQLGHMVISAW